MTPRSQAQTLLDTLFVKGVTIKKTYLPVIESFVRGVKTLERGTIIGLIGKIHPQDFDATRPDFEEGYLQACWDISKMIRKREIEDDA